MLQGFSGEGRRKQRGKKGKKEAGREEGLGSWEGRRKLEGNKVAVREEGSWKGRRNQGGKKEAGMEEGSGKAGKVNLCMLIQIVISNSMYHISTICIASVRILVPL